VSPDSQNHNLIPITTRSTPRVTIFRPWYDIVFLVVFWRLRYKLSLRDLAEMFLIRGIVFTHEAVRDWEAKLAPLLAEGLRKRRAGKVGRCWHVDET
jgi:putative transposase